MAKEKSSSYKPRGKKSKARSKDAASEPTVENLQHIKTANKDLYGKPKKTRNLYAAYVKHGKQFLSELVGRRQEEGRALVDNINTDELAKAFDENKPNQYSADALELFLTHKCFNQGLGSSTADGIQAAFASFWDNM